MQRKLAALFAGETDNWAVQLFRYALVGGVAFLFDFGVLFLLKDFSGLPYLWAGGFAFCVGVAANYVLSVTWVFHKRAVKNRQVEFVIFAALGVIGLAVNELLLFVLTEWVGCHYLASKVVATAVCFLCNYLSRKALLFSASARERLVQAEQVPLA